MANAPISHVIVQVLLMTWRHTNAWPRQFQERLRDSHHCVDIFIPYPTEVITKEALRVLVPVSCVSCFKFADPLEAQEQRCQSQGPLSPWTVWDATHCLAARSSGAYPSTPTGALPEASPSLSKASTAEESVSNLCSAEQQR